MDRESEVLAAGLRSNYEHLSDGERGLAIGHSPTNEAGVYRLTGVLVAPLGKGDAVIITALSFIGWTAIKFPEQLRIAFANPGPLIGANVAVTGVVLAIIHGVLFTWVLIFCQRLDRVGAGAIFGLRIALYVVFAGSCAALGLDQKQATPYSVMAVMALVGLYFFGPLLAALGAVKATVKT